MLHISPKLEHRDIAIILGTGAEKLGELGIRTKGPIELSVTYSVLGEEKTGRAEVYDAEVGGVPIYLLSRHSSKGAYTPAYKIDHTPNILALIDDDHGAGSKVILASSLVGGCRTTDWEIGDIILVEDGIDMHGDDLYVDGNEPYIHAHGLFNRRVSKILLEKAGQMGIDVLDGGIYYSGPDTTGNRFETPAEMAKLLAPAYLRKYLATIAKELQMQPLDNFMHLYGMDKLEPNLVGMTLVREAGYVRAFSTRSKGYKNENVDKNKHLAKFAGFAVISDFPESEETAHETNVGVALGKLPIIMEIFAEAVPTIQKELSDGQL